MANSRLTRRAPTRQRNCGYTVKGRSLGHVAASTLGRVPSSCETERLALTDLLVDMTARLWKKRRGPVVQSFTIKHAVSSVSLSERRHRSVPGLHRQHRRVLGLKSRPGKDGRDHRFSSKTWSRAQDTLSADGKMRRDRKARQDGAQCGRGERRVRKLAPSMGRYGGVGPIPSRRPETTSLTVGFFRINVGEDLEGLPKRFAAIRTRIMLWTQVSPASKWRDVTASAPDAEPGANAEIDEKLGGRGLDVSVNRFAAVHDGRSHMLRTWSRVARGMTCHRGTQFGVSTCRARSRGRSRETGIVVSPPARRIARHRLVAQDGEIPRARGKTLARGMK